MKKKILSIVLASVLCLSFLTGCQLGSRTSSVPEEEGTVTAYAVDFEANVQRTTNDYDSDTQFFLKLYNNTVSSSEKIEIQYFADIETMSKQLSTELLSGGGPDLFVFRDIELPNFFNYARQGTFTDLAPYLKKSGYDQRQFQEAVFNYGVVDGTQRFIPLEYGIPLCVTTQSLAEEYGLDKIGEELNYQNYYELLSKIKDMDICWFSEIESFRDRMIPAFIDEGSLEGQFTSPEFYKSIEEYRKLKGNQAKYTLETEIKVDYMEALVNQRLIFYNEPMASDRYLDFKVDNYLGTPEGKKDPLLLYPIKEYNGEDYCAYVGEMLAINDNSNRKNKAWEVIDKSISTSFQSSISGGSGCPIIRNPINIEAQMANQRDWMNSGSIMQKRARKEFVNQYYELLNSITKCDCLTYNPIYVQEVFDPLYLEYESGTKTLDEFVKELQNKTGLYLKEQN